MCATVRLRKNQIRVLEVDDSPILSHSGKEKVLHDFYHNLLGIASPTCPIDHLPSLLAPTALDSFQSFSLVTDFSLTEIKNGLWSMRNDSSPSLTDLDRLSLNSFGIKLASASGPFLMNSTVILLTSEESTNHISSSSQRKTV